jgi:Methyltransferase domain
MIEVAECVGCGGAIRRLRRALVAPFVARRIWNRAPFCVDLVECDRCGFLFYNPRLDDADLRRLYAGYRLPDYQQMRHASEPWYTPAFNESLASKELYVRRRAALAPLLEKHLADRPIRRVLDHGGDRGDLVAGLIPGAEAFVYDISGIPAAAGVTAVADPATCRPDLIVNSNVLEHVGFPRDLIASILAAAGDGLVYLEVPAENPAGLSRIVRRIAQIGVMTLAHPSLASSIVRPATLYMMHEHINYFTEHSLTAMFRAAGGNVQASGTYTVEARPSRAEFAWCLGTRDGANA